MGVGLYCEFTDIYRSCDGIDKSAIIWNYENKKVTLGLLNDFLHFGSVSDIF